MWFGEGFPNTTVKWCAQEPQMMECGTGPQSRHVAPDAPPALRTRKRRQRVPWRRCGAEWRALRASEPVHQLGVSNGYSEDAVHGRGYRPGILHPAPDGALVYPEHPPQAALAEAEGGEGGAEVGGGHDASCRAANAASPSITIVAE